MILWKEMKLGWKIALSNFNLLKNPYKLTFAITYRCNSRCKTCSIWKKKPKNELTLSEIEEFSKKSGFFNWINLTGGEPFLRKDIVSIAQILQECNDDLFLFNTTTNGYNPDLIYENTKEFVSLGIPKTIVVVSLDGPKEIHEEIRGVPCSWKKVLETYKMLKDLSEENKNFQTFFGFTISPFNIGKFRDTFSALKEVIPNIKPTDIHVNLFHSADHYYGNVGSSTKLKYYRKNVLKELNTIQEMKGTDFLNPIRFLEEKYVKLAKNFVQNNRTPLKCKAIMTSCFIDSWGNVFPCTIFNKKLGSLRDSNYDLMKILNSKSIDIIKKDVKNLNCPNCWTPCEAYQMILGNIFK